MPISYDSEDNTWQIRAILTSSSKLLHQILQAKIKLTSVQMEKTKTIILYNRRSYLLIEVEQI
jgi:hypothetical protein